MIDSEVEDDWPAVATEATSASVEKKSPLLQLTEVLLNVDHGETGCVLILFAHAGVCTVTQHRVSTWL